ncbi:MAG: cation diffusion facilitator family transporter [Chloroflexi bacterium]|jgi:cation diffusion facilitator family transporter|nr:cation diffusion facilitator family transporter [Chloroflexota bacterium]
MDSTVREKRTRSAVNIGLGANILLAALKTTVGILGHSPALLADGVNSTSDVAYYIVVSIFMNLSHKPADPQHPYGHRQLESIAALLVGAFVMVTGIAIFWDAVNRVFDQWSGAAKYTGAATSALYIALFTVLLKIGLTIFTQRIGRQVANPAVEALAYDHRNDILAASAAAVGIFLGRAGLPWVDPLAGALVSLVIFRTGVEIVRGSSAELMDVAPSGTLLQEVRAALAEVPGVRQMEEITTHRFGPYLVLNLTIGVDGSLSVAEGDRIASQVERRLYERIDLVKRVHIHYHPVIPAAVAAGAPR